MCWCESHFGLPPPSLCSPPGLESSPDVDVDVDDDGSCSGGRLYRGLAPAFGRLLRL